MNLGCLLSSSLRMAAPEIGTVEALRINHNGGHFAEGRVSSGALAVRGCLCVMTAGGAVRRTFLFFIQLRLAPQGVGVDVLYAAGVLTRLRVGSNLACAWGS